MYHIRAHAAEGVLFRRVLDLARRKTNSSGEPSGIEARPDFWRELGPDSANGQTKAERFGTDRDASVACDEKQAATAAWLVLQTARK